MLERALRGLLAGLVVINIASAATLTVTSSLDDGGAGTLRAKLAAAAAGDTIAFSLPNPSVITLNSNSLLVTKSLTINGPGAAALTVRQSPNQFGGMQDGFIVSDGLDVVFAGFTLTHSQAPVATGTGITGGTGGTLRLSEMLLRSFDASAYLNNAATIERSTFDGNNYAIYPDDEAAVVTVRNSAILNAPFGYYGVAVYTGAVTLINSTLAGNDTGIYQSSGTSLAVIGSTIAGNGIGYETFTTSPIFSFTNTLLANNSTGNCLFHNSVVATSGGHNFDSDGRCNLNGAGEQKGTPGSPLDAHLGALANNGGPTRTMALLAASTAIDAVPVVNCVDHLGAPLGTDQRGTNRPTGAACDIGAYEFGGGYNIVTTVVPAGGGSVVCTPNPVLPGGSSSCTATPVAGYGFIAFSGACSGATCNLSNVSGSRSVTAAFGSLTVTSTADDGSSGTLRAALAAATTGQSIQFALPNPSVITLNGNSLLVTKSLTINGPGAAALTVRQSPNQFGGMQDGFIVSDGLDVVFAGFTLTHSQAPVATGTGITGGTGGTLRLSEMLLRSFDASAYLNNAATIERSTFDGNNYAIYPDDEAAVVTVRNSAILNAPFGYYGVAVYTGAVTLINSTLAGNDTGIYQSSGTSLAVIGSTIAGNGIGYETFTTSPIFSFTNTLLANNSTGNCLFHNSVVATSGGHNFDSDGRCNLSGAGEQKGTPGAPLDPRIGPLANNGGPTLSFALASDSTAINAVPDAQCDGGSAVPVTTDQRGLPRPSGRGCDIGSFELQFVLDVDRNQAGGPYNAMADGLLIVRYLAGVGGPALTAGALSPVAARTDPVAVKQYLDAILPQLDIDGDGLRSAATDGLLILRYLLGVRGQALIAGVIDVNAVPPPTRTTPQAIESYLLTLMP